MTYLIILFEASLQTLDQCILFFHFRIAYSYFTCLRASWFFFYFVTAVVVMNFFLEHDYLLFYYTRVLNVCEYIQTYSLACPWLLSWPDFRAWR